MKASNTLWREHLLKEMPEVLAKEIDVFENEIRIKKQGKIEDPVFGETRLRRGVYGQRYDNGQRNDGQRIQHLHYPSGDMTKGPHTLWDAPGMQRIKIPFGGLTADQLEVMAELAEEYSDNIAHVTTRQDFQLHYIHIDDTPSIMRRLARVGITTREACGNAVRNVTACPIAGVCHDESFDVTPYADACARFLLGHPDAQEFGRKFKVAFSGCADKACGLVRMHDLGFIAKTRDADGVKKRGFAVYVGGGLGTIPHQAKLMYAFMPVEEMLPLTQAVARVFARLGEKKNRNRARIKFLVSQLGLEQFTRLVEEERKTLTQDPKWTALLQRADHDQEKPKRAPAPMTDPPHSEAFQQWIRTNVYHQRQEGYVTATITLPMGDITGQQLRCVADICRQYIHDTIRITVEQNMVLRWVREADLPAIYAALQEADLAGSGAGTIVDVTACPGTDTCKLGIASSRGLALELMRRLAARSPQMDDAIQNLHIKISGCFNSCGQHHVCDIGFYGVSRHKDRYNVPHFQVILGGQWEENAGAYGLAIGAIPAKNIPETVERLADHYLRDRLADESFQDFVKRIGKVRMKTMLEDLTHIPSHDDDAGYYRDWGDPREFTLGDLGIGECAGEVVSQVQFGLAASEREAFEAQILLDKTETEAAAKHAFGAMLHAAKSLLSVQIPDISDHEDTIVHEFRIRLYDTKLFFDPYVKGKFAHYLFSAHAHKDRSHSSESAHQLVEEAQLFIEACHSCYARMMAAQTSNA